MTDKPLLATTEARGNRAHEVRAHGPVHDDMARGPRDARGAVAGAPVTTVELLRLQRTIGNAAVARLTERNAPVVQRDWNSKCPDGGPDPFDPVAALNAADFSNCTYVNLAKAVVQGWNYTVYAYTFVEIADSTGAKWRVCVVAHLHLRATTDAHSQRKDKALVDANWGPGNVFIPGWDGWATPTPAGVVDTLRDAWKAAVSARITPFSPAAHPGDLHGTFPAARYPTRV